MPAPTVTTRPQPAGDTAFEAWDAYGLAREGLALWSTACGAWGDYFTLLARASGPAAVFDAQMRLFAEGLDLCSQAAGERLKDAGVTTPLLNDA